MLVEILVALDCACEDCRHGSQGCAKYPDGKIPAGVIHSHPEAWKLVRGGVAIPADEECEKAANMTERQMLQAQRAARRSHIHPDDYEAFEAGEMIGYYDDGSFKPGPNAAVSEGGIILNDGWDSDV